MSSRKIRIRAAAAVALALALCGCAPGAGTGSTAPAPAGSGGVAEEKVEQPVRMEAALGTELEADALKLTFTWCGWADEVRSDSGDAGLQADAPGESYLVMSGTIENTGEADAVLGYGAGGALRLAVECGGVNADATVLADAGGFTPVLPAGASTKVVAFARMPDEARNSKAAATWTISGFKAEGAAEPGGGDTEGDASSLAYYRERPSWVWTLGCPTA